MKRHTNCLMLAAICCALMCGCQKKEEADKAQIEQRRQPQKQEARIPTLDVSDIDPAVIIAFPMVEKYLYPFATIKESDTTPMEETDFELVSKLPDIVKVEYFLETNDQVGTVQSFYLELFGRDKMRMLYKDEVLSTVVASDIFHKEGYRDIPYEVQVKVSRPAAHFDDEVIESQLSAIEKQIEQYKKIMSLQQRRIEAVPDSADIASIEAGIEQSQERIDDLRMQALFLNNRTTLVHITIKYLYVKAVRYPAGKEPVQ